jgi:anti-sigma B factor antagonist
MTQPDPASILPLEGEIDLHVAPRLESSLARITKQRPPHVVVDLSGVTFIDSSGLAVLIRAMQDVQNYGGKLSLAGISAEIRSIFEMARLDQVFLIDQCNDELLAGD